VSGVPPEVKNGRQTGLRPVVARFVFGAPSTRFAFRRWLDCVELNFRSGGANLKTGVTLKGMVRHFVDTTPATPLRGLGSRDPLM
jgi:hypothetical protein